MHYYLLLLVASLLHTTTSTVYYVMPDNHYHPINDNTYTLQHYLNNTNKYFTSNTQLHFLPGQYYLNDDLIIQGVSNLSLIGDRTNEVINTVINCTSPAGIAVVGSSNIVIANIAMNECGNNYKSFMSNIHQYNNGGESEDINSLFVLDSKSITITYFHSLWYQKLCGFELVNALESALSNLVSNYLLISYIGNDNSATNKIDTLFIENFQTYSEIHNIYPIRIAWNNTAFDFQAKILNVNFTNDLALHVSCTQCLGHNAIVISNCSFSDSYAGEDIPTIYDINYEDDYGSFNYNYSYEDLINDNFKPTCVHEYSCMSKIKIHYYFTNPEIDQTTNNLLFSDCHFINNFRTRVLLVQVANNFNWKVKTHVQSVIIYNCLFYSNKNTMFLSAECYNNGDSGKYCVSVLIKNTTISSNFQKHNYLINANHVTLTFESSIIINNTILDAICIIKARDSYITYSKYNEISNNSADYVIGALTIHINENSILNISFNVIFHVIFSIQHAELEVCAIQYISKRGNLDREFQSGQKLNYSVIVYMNNKSEISDGNLKHCEWDTTSAFLTSSPLHINQYFIQQNTSARKQHNKDICLCNENDHMAIDCYSEEMGPFYPGETISMDFALTSSYTHTTLVEKHHALDISCKGIPFSVVIRSHECKNMQFTVTHKNGIWCELLLRAVPLYSAFANIWTDVYTVTLLPCPRGFLLHSEGYCWCDPILSSYIPSIIHCNIDNQTIPRPANSWITAHTANNSHSYHVSLHCPFDYCLPHSSHLNLSTSDSQCQFNRSGVLCGQCQQGLSAVFGSSLCKQCSSIYLLIIIPIGIAGLALVLLLFILNLTVTNGDINAFLLYVNIIDINSSIFFPINGPGMAMHTFISLANLDLGITTCFYNGMDEYAKMWLQLVFPAYLILIAATIIMASRYSIRIQRLTARRALAVLATLFLLSYTKVLLVVSKTLFLYSAIVHLPSNHTALVWSVDANVPLLEIKFIILFIACAILFIILIPFNVLLIFARQLSRFKRINYFKPLLDAYQGPYKIRFYFWSGLQLLLRAILFGLSGLDRNTNLMISVILLGTLIWLTERFSPFKNQVNNILEALYMLNLLAMFTIALHTTADKHTVGITINILISLAILKLACIITVHVKNFCNANIKRCDCSRMTKRFSRYFGKLSGANDPPNSIELINPVPEVAYNYKEFQEPLIGQD